MISWNSLNNVGQLEAIKLESEQQKILIFKHSTRCSISDMALGRVEKSTPEIYQKFKPYLLDVISSRDVSNLLESTFNIKHESPQILIIYKGKCIYTNSHSGINLQNISENLE